MLQGPVPQDIFQTTCEFFGWQVTSPTEFLHFCSFTAAANLLSQPEAMPAFALAMESSPAYNARMKSRYAYALCALLAAASSMPAAATEDAMKAALGHWEQEMTEYRAALSSAQSDEARSEIKAPDGKGVGKELWKAISGKTGTRKKVIQGTKGPALESVEERVLTVPTYEFEEKWAAPAVVWFLERPQVLVEVFEGKPSRLAGIVEALWDAVQEKHYDSPLMARICHLIAAKPDVQRYEMLKKIYLRNTDRNARGCAAMGMSIMLGNPMVSSAEGSDAMAMNKRLYYLKQALTLTDDNTAFGDISLSEAASNQTYIIRHLTKGQTPPLVTMSTVDGQKASFPVKGVPSVLFFWHPSEQIGTDIVAKHQSLKKQFPSLQFLPVTAHPLDDQLFREDLKTLGIPFTYVDDEQGSISLAYRVSMLPLAVFADARGDILYIGYPDIKLQTALDSYFRSLPASHTSTGSANVGSGGQEEVLIQPGSRPSALPAHPQSSQPSSVQSGETSEPAPAGAATPAPAGTDSTDAVGTEAAPQAGAAPQSPPAEQSTEGNSGADAPPPLRPMPSF